jgi:hypothetical protein
MKPKQLTFVWQNMSRYTINTLQWQTTRRTVGEAWDDAEKFLLDRDTDCDPALVLVFKGLPEVMDDNKPLRAPTHEEIKELAKP